MNVDGNALLERLQPLIGDVRGRVTPNAPMNAITWFRTGGPAELLSIFIALWLDKGLGFVFGGLVVNPLHEINEYYPTLNEILIAIGIWATGAFLVTVLYKIAITVDKEVHE